MIILYLLIAAVVVFVIVVAMQPADFHVTRSATINAPAAGVFAQINDFHLWEAWSPWAKIDPACRNTFEGPTAGAGAKFSWAGNKKVGEGRMAILESRAGELIRIHLEFLKPFKATNTTEFVFKPQAGQTVVTWSMFGKNNYVSKAFSLFVNCDKMIGGDFEKGLANLRAVAEAAVKN